ncbi:site-specific DNA-methyltransferase [Limosilactobacillus reuteri]|uniref:site-specific DNA-methyltransferase n=1 Tax=Limosilactobacillus reuteri TaxID=1598 RepID=UPI00098F3306|nr:site-specific DNA-methyltransferase [Limosilactobacillus reuteri]WOZ73484.1 DNA methyltransferase [Limosilactobacillus reuteri]
MQTDNEKYNETVQPNTAFLNELKEKLPEFFTREGSFDLEKFRNQLKDKNINELSEGYQLDFIGKDYARRQAGEMPNTVIVPDEKQNQGEGKNSKNLFFTGDNLEVLRHLQNNYQNKVDVIYIDPPYNTGNDGFVYPDSFEYSDDKLKDMFGFDDDQVERLKSIQGKSSHSAWLTFMMPRLILAKNLLKDSGIIFVSIDDNEESNLSLLMEEVFGEGDFVNRFIWTKTSTPPSLSSKSRQTTEYVITFERNQSPLKKYFGSNNDNLDASLLKKTNSEKLIVIHPNCARFKFIQKGNLDAGKYGNIKLLNNVIINNGKNVNEMKISAHTVWSQNKVDEELKNGTRIIFKTKSLNPRYLRQRNDNYKAPNTNLNKEEAGVGTNESASNYITQLGFSSNVFTNPKPVTLIKYLVQMVTYDEKDKVILDFFAGSSTTADAVMQLNAEDGGHRKFIMVQLPEKTYHINKDGREVPTKGGKAAYDAGFKSIDEISRERIRRAAKKIREDNELTLPEDFDGSFKHYRVVKPVKQTLEEIEDFDTNNTNLFTNMVDGFSSNSLGITGNATGEATILTTWLAKDGYSFDADVEEVKFGNYSAHKVEDNRLYLINEGWGADQTKELLNQLGTRQLEIQSVVIFGYSFNVAELRELENGLKQLDSKVTLIKRY